MARGEAGKSFDLLRVDPELNQLRAGPWPLDELAAERAQGLPHHGHTDEHRGLPPCSKGYKQQAGTGDEQERLAQVVVRQADAAEQALEPEPGDPLNRVGNGKVPVEV